MSGETLDRPVVQILGQKKIAGNSGSIDRYRLLLSDGQHSHSSCMLATQLNDKVLSGELETLAIIRLEKYICNAIQPDRRVMIILEVSLVASPAAAQHKIGNPQPLRISGGGAPGGDQNGAPPGVNGVGVTQQPKAESYTNPPPRPMAASNGAMNATNPTANQAASTQNKFYGGTSGASGSAGAGQQINKPYGAGGAGARPAYGGTGGGGGAMGGAGPAVDTPMKVYPIASLTPYQNRWTIRARVTQKSAVKTWSNSRGEGSLFSLNLLDESGEIRATAFKSEVDKFYNLIEVNKVYYVRKATLKTANKQFSNTANDYEMTFNGDTEVIPCEDATDLPSVTFTFVPINQLEQHQPNTVIDVIGVVKEVQEVKTIVTKATQKEMKKRDVVLVDESQVQVNLTLWGTDAEQFDGAGQPILAVKGARLSDWGGRSLSASNNSQMLFNPDIPESHRLRGWFDSVGHSSDFGEYRRDGASGGGAGGTATWKTLSEVKAQNLGQDKVEYFNVKAEVALMKKDNCMYQACPQPDCNKKVVDQSNGMFRCEKCTKEYPDYKWRMLLQMNIVDFSGDLWVTCFQDTAEIVLNKKADEIGRLKQEDPSAFDQLFSDNIFRSYVFRCRAKMETFNDESRLKTVCVGANLVNFKEHNLKLIADIEALMAAM